MATRSIQDSFFHTFLVIIMLVAISTTKIPIFLNQGFWAMAHEARTDWSMLLGSIFLLITGAGAWSVGNHLSPHSGKPT